MSFLKAEAKKQDEETELLRNEVSSLREIIANWLTPEAAAPTIPTKKASKGKSLFFSKKDKEEKVLMPQKALSS
ncbi:hypothetical protein [Legionella maioricensis]|uniref:Uncharacterized protein n=1 Tax=Legionella maioricensis TaxID=2896528 RepID=A0A9X2CYQ7_9GAMM|nr:hypothetical protein [Legionella maioricensis]MCL9683233.1 hypothetical protein [Legionella maioricensis]MCL9686069.1 hypothetical protein [Legionella maioricensis]